MKLKHIVVSIGYLILIGILTSPILVGIFNRGWVAAIAGVIVLILITVMYVLWLSMSLKGTSAVIDVKPATAIDKYQDMVRWFQYFKSFGYSGGSVSTQELEKDFANVYWQGMMNHNPFRGTQLGDRIQEVASDIASKYNQTVSILKDSFNSTDITFVNYTSVLDNVLKISSAHLKSIKKRIIIFDYREYSVNAHNDMCMQYIDEVEDNVIKLEGIEDKFDHLIHELVCLSEISEAPLGELQALIDSTSDYKTLEEEY